MIRYEKLTIAILASNERKLLRETVGALEECCSPEDVEEIIVFFISENCPAKAEFDAMLAEEEFIIPLRGCVQERPGFSACFYEVPRLVRSSHFLIIGSDMEMDPRSAPELIAIAKKRPDAIICASKWKKGSVVRDYSLLHKAGVFIINSIVSVIMGVRGTELIATFQIYPTEIYRRMDISDPGKAFCEFTLKPIAAGVPYIEIPTNYVRRNEGESNFRIIPYLKVGFQYVSTALRLRITKK